jgi:hypothetical protein
MVEFETARSRLKAVPSKYRVCAYFADEKVLKLLERQAANENRSLSNLAATILMKAAEEYEAIENQQEGKPHD